MTDPFNPTAQRSQIAAFKGNFVDKFVPREQLMRPSLAQKKQTTEFTQRKIDEIVDQKTFISQRAMAAQVQTRPDAEYVRFTSRDNPADTKTVKIQEVPEDPFAPAQFKTKRIPQGPGSPPRTILRSPPRALTAETQKEWKIPPAVSNWKNKKGFTIPLEMRLAADGRAANPPTINENFAKFSSALYASEKAVKKELEEKEQVRKQLAMEDLRKAEDKVRERALITRQRIEQSLNEGNASARYGTQVDVISRFDKEGGERDEDDEGEKKRNEIRAMVRRDNVRTMRMETMGRHQKMQAKERERDIAERVALGEDVAGTGPTGLNVDSRLLSRDKGMAAGHLDEDAEDIYDKPLFKEQEKANIYAVRDLDAQVERGGYFESLKSRKGNKEEGLGSRGRQMPVQFQKDTGEMGSKRVKMD